MPTLLGFKEQNGKVQAVIDFPNARRHELTKDANGQLAISVSPQPRRAAYDSEGAQSMIRRCMEKGEDATLWSDAAKGAGQRQEQLDHIKAHGASNYSGEFMLAAYQSTAPEQIVVPGLMRKPDTGLNH